MSSGETAVRATSERKLLMFINLALAGVGAATLGYVLVSGQLLEFDGLMLTLVALLTVVVFGSVAVPDFLAIYGPLPPAVDHKAAEAYAAHAHGDSIPLYMKVWAGLLVLTLLEVGLAYLQLSVALMLLALLGLSIMKAALIIAYFMHLRFERLSLVLTLMPALVMCICLLGVFFPDSFRILSLGTGQ
jgi:cytochrome c oxidase subunit 4